MELKQIKKYEKNITDHYSGLYMTYDLPPAASGGCTKRCLRGRGDDVPGIQCWLIVRIMTKVNRGVKSAALTA